MGSTFFNIHYPNISRQNKIDIIEKMYNGDSLPFFKKRYVNELDEIAQITDWDRLYESVNYLEFCMNSYTLYVRPTTRLRGFSKKLTKAETKAIKEFYKINNWRKIVSKIAKFRKLYGDVYVYWFLNENKIPVLKILPSKYIEVKVDIAQNPIAYIFEKDVYWDERQSDGSYLAKNKTVKMEFKKGKVETYENEKLINTELNDMIFENIIPIIHFQFEKNENSPYSEIPSEALVDLCLTLDRIETDISDINHSAG